MRVFYVSNVGIAFIETNHYFCTLETLSNKKDQYLCNIKNASRKKINTYRWKQKMLENVPFKNSNI